MHQNLSCQRIVPTTAIEIGCTIPDEIPFDAFYFIYCTWSFSKVVCRNQSFWVQAVLLDDDDCCCCCYRDVWKRCDAHTRWYDAIRDQPWIWSGYYSYCHHHYYYCCFCFCYLSCCCYYCYYYCYYYYLYSANPVMSNQHYSMRRRTMRRTRTMRMMSHPLLPATSSSIIRCSNSIIEALIRTWRTVHKYMCDVATMIQQQQSCRICTVGGRIRRTNKNEIYRECKNQNTNIHSKSIQSVLEKRDRTKTINMWFCPIDGTLLLVSGTLDQFICHFFHCCVCWYIRGKQGQRETISKQ
jgi:hypothetical protein